MIARRRILLADDHALVRAGIRALLESLPRVVVVGETGDGLEAVELVRRDPPDAILLDITLPGLNGLDTLRAIRQFHPAAQVIMLSGRNAPATVIEAVRLVSKTGGQGGDWTA